MAKNKELKILGILLAVAVVLGLSFVLYYRETENGSTLNENKEVAPQGNEAENYPSKIKVTFTNEVYPRDIYQSNPRLRTYVGKVQNTGDKTVDFVSIKVYYLDKEGKSIWEEVVSVSDTLKPNYIKEFPFGGVNVSSEWAGKVTYGLTSLQFENRTRVEIPSRRGSPLDRPPFPNILFPIF
jgi:hypothetical protein